MFTQRIIHVLGFVVVFTGSGWASIAAGDTSPQSKTDVLVAMLEHREIRRIEILQLSPNTLTRTRITPDMLETGFDYKFVIHDIRGGAYREGLLAAARSVTVSAQTQMPDLRWGMVFYGEMNDRLGAVFFDRSGARGAVDTTPVRFQGEPFDWLDENFSKCFQ